MPAVAELERDDCIMGREIVLDLSRHVDYHLIVLLMVLLLRSLSLP
jgi:hypothetical protein